MSLEPDPPPEPQTDRFTSTGPIHVAPDSAGDRGGGGSCETGLEVLSQVVPGDPLGVRSQVVRRLRERCLLLDPHGVAVQVLAQIAQTRDRRSGNAHGNPSGHEVTAAVEAVIDECACGRLEVPLAGFPRGGVLSQLATALKVNQVDLKGACDRFNSLPASARRAFHALVLQRRSLESACRRSATAAEQWSQGAARGLREIIGAKRAELGNVTGDSDGTVSGSQPQTLFG